MHLACLTHRSHMRRWWATLRLRRPSPYPTPNPFPFLTLPSHWSDLHASPQQNSDPSCNPDPPLVTQIAYATVAGDIVVAAAYSHELTKYGVVAGFKNFAAAYATGLLLARRVLAKYGLADTYKVRRQ